MRKVIVFILFALTLIIVTSSCFQYKYTYTNNIALANVQPKRIIPIYVDKHFAVQDKLAIDNAVAQWNYVLNGQMVLTIVNYNFDMEPELIKQAQTDHAFLFLRINSDMPGIPDEVPQERCRVTPGCKFTLAWVDRIGGTVMKVVRDRMDSSDVEHIVLHEIGHMLYLSHDKDKNSLMFPYYSKFAYLCVDHKSAERVSLRYGLNFNHMNYCVGKY
jgi:hypothetical protein